MKYFCAKVEIEEFEAGMKTLVRGGVMNGRQAGQMTRPVTDELKVPVKAEKIDDVKSILAEMGVSPIRSIREIDLTDFEIISTPEKLRTIRSYFNNFDCE